jgi:hypothetical protein
MDKTPKFALQSTISPQDTYNYLFFVFFYPGFPLVALGCYSAVSRVAYPLLFGNLYLGKFYYRRISWKEIPQNRKKKK